MALVAVAIASAWMFFQLRAAPIDGSRVNPDFQALGGMSEAHRGVVLTGETAIEFVLPAATQLVRLITNANLHAIDSAREQRQADPARRWQYAIEVEELDALGTALRRTTHHFRRDLLEMRMPDGRPGTGAFYADAAAPKPLTAAVLRLDFSAAGPPARLRIKLIDANPELADVLLRVHTPEPVSQRGAETIWRRFSEEQRRHMASGNLFPPELLIEQERNNLIASRWRPLGPAGTPPVRDIHVLQSADLGGRAGRTDQAGGADRGPAAGSDAAVTGTWWAHTHHADAAR